MQVRRGLKVTVAGCLAALLASACGSGDTPPPATPPPPPPPPPKVDEPAPAVAAPILCPGQDRLSRLVADFAPLPAPDGMRLATARLESGAKSAAEAYKKAAPSTVFVRTPVSLGTGVVVADDLVLTNYHVVDDGRQDDMTIELTLQFAKIGDLGSAELIDKEYTGVVVKADKVRDMALIRVKDMPKTAKPVVVSKRDVDPGSPVVVIGHAGSGLLWSTKECTVSSHGKLSDALSRIRGLDCKKMAATKDDPGDQQRLEKACEERREELIDEVTHFNAGLVTQTDCSLNSGDSGGPLLTVRGDLIGLNFGGVRATGFGLHVHVREIREFLQSVPESSYRAVPNPWCDAGTQASLADVDMNGVIDAIGTVERMQGGGGVFFDLDEDHYTKQHTATPFDAEVVFMSDQNRVYAYYDTDNEGTLDLLVTAKRDQPDEYVAFQLDGGRPVADGKEGKGAVLDPSRLKNANPDMVNRFARLVDETGAMQFAAPSLRGGKSDPNALPDPFVSAGREGELRDVDGDGRPDTAMLSGAFAKAIIYDSDQDTLGTKSTSDDAASLLKEQGLDSEAAVVANRLSAWVFYDTSADGTYDLALYAEPRHRVTFAQRAWTRKDNGAWTPSNEHQGRFLLRPQLVEGGELSRMMGYTVPLYVAKDEGLGSLPPVDLLDNWAVIDGTEKYPASFVRDSTTVLFDLRGESKAKAGANADDALDGGTFVYHAAVFLMHGGVWAFHDTDLDGKLDLVMHSDSGRHRAQRGWRVKGDRLEYDEGLSGQKMLDDAVYRDIEARRRYMALVEHVFE